MRCTQIGYLHGTNARDGIARAVEFYAKLFMKHSKLSWPEVQALASDFDGVIQSKWPRYYQELKGWVLRWHHATETLICYVTTGIADGAGRQLNDIIALNVRTEIVFGQFSDGCTSLYYRGDGSVYMGQNWDVRFSPQGPYLSNDVWRLTSSSVDGGASSQPDPRYHRPRCSTNHRNDHGGRNDW